MDLHFEVRLEERLVDRVFVSVVLAAKSDAGTVVDGVSVQMLTRQGNALCPRMLLPISGTLTQPMVSTIELRALGKIPVGARVSGTAWTGKQQFEASCPCDPGTALGVHMRGLRLLPLTSDTPFLLSLDPGQREVLVALFPWLNGPMVATETPGILESSGPDSEELMDDFAEKFDLDPEDAEFLKNLLAED